MSSELHFIADVAKVILDEKKGVMLNCEFISLCNWHEIIAIKEHF